MSRPKFPETLLELSRLAHLVLTLACQGTLVIFTSNLTHCPYLFGLTVACARITAL